MNRRQFLAVSGIGVATAMAGCVGSAFEDESEPEAQGLAGDEYGTIEVSASGRAETDPDRAIVHVGVEARGESADDVRSELVEGAESLRETFAELGIPEDDVQTANYRINERRQETGFEGVHAFRVTVDDVDRVGEIIDASVEAGADTVGRVNFTLQDETREALRDEALDDALANADEEADHIAGNREVEITATQSVSTTDVDVRPVRYDAAHEVADDGAAGQSTEIDSGPVTVSATVTVVYRFEY
ncbi:SIMPL domain-containing protein [Halobacteria archaeon AArc-m2/3/4]|uniref:SIMPL domain-containing protein n=1 Tax=Natronoglomus mannanivorans TaxID=2979990 RepID=A0AAP2YXM6_9EURY|nr:SIMPL domain-containing protein [Halobacteria archaeon AArc-xg1-1]MCU4972471.1 SIMPL domain-containing protein [Halobacteria archaeon AArc-m2/3/4]